VGYFHWLPRLSKNRGADQGSHKDDLYGRPHAIPDTGCPAIVNFSRAACTLAGNSANSSRALQVW
jgi:hypothetical protein